MLKKALGNISILLGFALLSYSLFLTIKRLSPSPLNFTSYKTSETQPQLSNKNSDNPKTLVINSIGINLPVVASKVTNNKWETTEAGVSFLETSAKPGKLGNSVFYGHNWNSLLGNLKKVKVGDSIEIQYENEKVKEFEVKYIQVVEPNTIGILDNTSDARITLYTCTGFFDTKRLVVTAFLKADLSSSSESL